MDELKNELISKVKNFNWSIRAREKNEYSVKKRIDDLVEETQMKMIKN